MAQDKNPGNFANDREKASEAGRKGGQQSQGHQQEQSGSGNKSQQGSGAAGGKMPGTSHKTGQK